MTAQFVTGTTQSFADDLLKALGLDHLKGIMGLGIVVSPEQVVRVEVSMAVTTEQADELLVSLRNRRYALVELQDDDELATDETVADHEPTAA